MILEIRRTSPNSLIKIIARVSSEFLADVSYTVGYIRSKTFRGWVCKCDDFLYRRIATNRNCKHIKEVRSTYGRYGAKVL